MMETLPDERGDRRVATEGPGNGRVIDPQGVPGDVAWPVGASRSISRLGRPLDRWGDTIDGMGEKAPAVRDAFRRIVAQRQIPFILYEQTALNTGALGSLSASVAKGLMDSPIGPLLSRVSGASTQEQQRDHFVLTDRARSLVTVYIAPYGRDLYLGWTLYASPLLNLWAVLIIFGLPLIWVVFGVINAFAQLSGNGYGVVFGVGSFVGALLATALSYILWVIVLSLILAVLGRIFTGAFSGFILREQNLFEATDRTVLSISVDKSLREAADRAGIEMSLLRIKEQFRVDNRNILV